MYITISGKPYYLIYENNKVVGFMSRFSTEVAVKNKVSGKN